MVKKLPQRQCACWAGMNTGGEQSCLNSRSTAITFQGFSVLHGDDMKGTYRNTGSAANAFFSVKLNVPHFISLHGPVGASIHTFSAVSAAVATVGQRTFGLHRQNIPKGRFIFLGTDIILIHTGHLTGLTSGTLLRVEFDFHLKFPPFGCCTGYSDSWGIRNRDPGDPRTGDCWHRPPDSHGTGSPCPLA